MTVVLIATQNRGLPSRRQSRMREEPVMNEAISCVGMDVHKDSIFVAVISPDG